MNLPWGRFWSDRKKKAPERFRRRLGIESLETRELLSASVSELPQPEYSAAVAVSQESVSDSDLVVQTTAATTKTKLLAPKSISKGVVATPSTLTVRWSAPTSTDGVTGYEITIRNSKTKAVVGTETVAKDETLSCKFVNLDPKTKYEILITSFGDSDTTDNSKATLKVNATTAAFPNVSIKAVKPGLTSTDVIITDKDKALPFVNGKTVKTYTIQYAPKATSINWDTAQSEEVPVGTAGDSSKGTIAWTIAGLQPGTSYTFRVIATYTEGMGESAKTLTSAAKTSTFKTAVLPAPTISKASYTVVDGEFGLFTTCKQTKTDLFQSGTVTYSLYFSTSTAKSGLIPNARHIGEDLSGTAATFSMKPVAMKTIGELLGDTSSDKPVLLGMKVIYLQLVAEYSDGNGVTAKIYSKVAKLTLPKWYVPV